MSRKGGFLWLRGGMLRRRRGILRLGCRLAFFWGIIKVLGLCPAVAQDSTPQTGEPKKVEQQSRPKSESVPSMRLKAVTLRWENDAVAGTDENYSNGTALSVSWEGRGWMGRFWDLFPIDASETDYFTSYEIGQMIITPRDTYRVPPDPHDRPYAGLLHVGVSTQLRLKNGFHGLKFVAGVVGPASLAEETQSWFHHLIGNHVPRGWDYQLKNEPFFNLVYEYRRCFRLTPKKEGFSAEAIPIVGAMAGTVLDQASLGLQLRAGYNIPNDFGTSWMRGFGNLPLPTGRNQYEQNRPPIGFYVFGTVGGVGVARNLTLDGNTFRAGPHVTKKPFFPTAEIGVSLWSRWGQLTASFVWWGKEFEGQSHASRFGTLTVSAYF